MASPFALRRLGRALALSRLGGALMHRLNMLRSSRRGLRRRGPFGPRRRGNRIRTHGAVLTGCSFDLRGSGNRIDVDPLVRLNGVRFTVRGDDHRIHLHRSVRVTHGGDLWLEGRACELSIGERTTIESAALAVTETGVRISIGRDCMLSTSVQLRTGDSHAIYDQESGRRINPARDIEIGDHVWIGDGAVVLKGVRIADGVVVGTRSVVTRSIDAASSVAAGQPARVVRTNVAWTRER